MGDQVLTSKHPELEGRWKVPILQCLVREEKQLLIESGTHDNEKPKYCPYISRSSRFCTASALHVFFFLQKYSTFKRRIQRRINDGLSVELNEPHLPASISSRKKISRPWLAHNTGKIHSYRSGLCREFRGEICTPYELLARALTLVTDEGYTSEMGLTYRMQVG